MCTVTFTPARDGIYLASNRDEKHHRGDALPPALYEFPYGRIVFPKDRDKGGTWIAMHENGRAIVLLNGGLEAHTPCPPYRKSRGIVLLELINSEQSVREFANADFMNIEPFTAVIWENNGLHECVWDGKEKHVQEKDAGRPHIWSSVTLYEETIRSKRRQWFENWLNGTSLPGISDILHFHQFTGEGDAHNDLLMNRNGEVFTVSITGMHLKRDTGQMIYLDMKNNDRSVFELGFRQAAEAEQK